MAPSLATLEGLVAPYEPERLRVAGRHDYSVAANWKMLTENYHECYHCRNDSSGNLRGQFAQEW